MWFYNDENEDRGFIALLKHARLMAWLCTIAFVGFVLWIFK